MSDTRCGTIAIVGPPNAGKSTLLNQLLGQKIAIVSPKVQTTRTRLAGVLTEGDAQFVFIDTPGIFTPQSDKRKLERAMVKAAWAGAAEADIVLLLLDAAEKSVLAHHTDMIAALKNPQSKTAGSRLYVALNKVDAINPEKLLPLASAVDNELAPQEIFMISAATGAGVEILKKKIAAALPTGPFLYDPDNVTDTSLRQLAAEFTREQLFLQLAQELPYDAHVETEKWEEEGGRIRVTQSIIVARDSQKGIVIGKGGSRLKEIGSAARAQIAELAGAPVHLDLHVKVKENWQDDADFYASWNLKK